MKNKGFTLIELTAVVILIGLIIALASIPINKILKDARKKLNEDQKNQFILAARNWASDNPYSLPPFIGSETSLNIELGQLLNSGYLDTELVDMMNKKNIPNCSYIKITLNTNEPNSDKNVYTYEFNRMESC